MIDYNIANLKNQLEPNKNKVILFGAGDIGELSNYSLNKLGIVVDFFCDNDPKKHGSKYLGVEVISMDALKKLDKNVNVLISNIVINHISISYEALCFKCLVFLLEKFFNLFISSFGTNLSKYSNHSLFLGSASNSSTLFIFF